MRADGGTCATLSSVLMSGKGILAMPTRGVRLSGLGVVPLLAAMLFGMGTGANAGCVTGLTPDGRQVPCADGGGGGGTGGGGYSGGGYRGPTAKQVREKKATELNNLGVDARQRGDLHQAVRYYQQSLKLRPSDSVTLKNLATAYNELGFQAHKRGDLEGALSWVEKAHRAFPADPTIKGNYQAARQRVADQRAARKAAAEAEEARRQAAVQRAIQNTLEEEARRKNDEQLRKQKLDAIFSAALPSSGGRTSSAPETFTFMAPDTSDTSTGREPEGRERVPGGFGALEPPSPASTVPETADGEEARLTVPEPVANAARKGAETGKELWERAKTEAGEAGKDTGLSAVAERIPGGAQLKSWVDEAGELYTGYKGIVTQWFDHAMGGASEVVLEVGTDGPGSGADELYAGETERVGRDAQKKATDMARERVED